MCNLFNINCLENIGKDKLEREKLGNRYGSKLKVYLIEDGKLTRPVRDVNIIGNGPQALGDIGLVGNDLKIDHSAGMCGKGGQSVPVSQGLPTVLVNRLVVG